MAKKDWTGHRFGNLTVVKFDYYDGSKRPIYKWLCKCDCGREKSAEMGDLRKGSISSCGCRTKELQSKAKMKGDGVAASNHLFYVYKNRCAEHRNYEFTLSKEEFLNLTQQNCYYCDKKPSTIMKSKCSSYTYNGIDRVENDKGYTLDNVVPCCKSCNSEKSGVSLQIIEKIVQFMRNKNA